MLAVDSYELVDNGEDETKVAVEMHCHAEGIRFFKLDVSV
jgi:hypothetical protein